ncbi:hypothetical protein [Gordonia sp. NPDC003429]
MTYDGDITDDEDIVVWAIESVFSTGKTPDATYNARLGVGLEAALRGHLRTASNAVTVFGPSKSGKTSLVERVVPVDAGCWIQGSDVETIDDFWALIAEQLQIAAEVTSETTSQTDKTDSVSGEVSIPFVKGGLQSEDSSGESNSTSATYQLRPEAQAKALLARTPIPIIIDDFHHVGTGIRKRIARSIKALIRHTCVVLIAIPSQAFDPVRNEQDLNGRIKALPVPEWQVDELSLIAQQGFSLLNVDDQGGALASELARYSFGSPHIMQELCYTVLREGFGLIETVKPTRSINIPDNLHALLRTAATASEPPFFEKLLEGLPTRGKDRKAVHLHGMDEPTDVYGVVMKALQELTPPMQHSVRDIQNQVNQYTSETVKRGRITSVLRGLDKIAQASKGDSDPALSFKDDKLYIEDSVFAFYLNHGPWKTPVPA